MEKLFVLPLASICRSNLDLKKRNVIVMFITIMQDVFWNEAFTLSGLSSESFVSKIIILQCPPPPRN